MSDKRMSRRQTSKIISEKISNLPNVSLTYIINISFFFINKHLFSLKTNTTLYLCVLVVEYILQYKEK
jgi:hypothetical protein